MGGLEVLKQYYQFCTTKEHTLHTDSGISQAETVAFPNSDSKIQNSFPHYKI